MGSDFLVSFMKLRRLYNYPLQQHTDLERGIIIIDDQSILASVAITFELKLITFSERG